MVKTKRFAHRMVVAGLDSSQEEAVLDITLDYEKVQTRYAQLCAKRQKEYPQTWAGFDEAKFWYYDRDAKQAKQLKRLGPDELAGIDINNAFNDALRQAVGWAKRNTRKPFRVRTPDEPIPLTGLPTD